MLAFEGAAFDVTTAFAGRLGTQKIAAHSAMLLIITLTFFSGPLPLATAASIRCVPGWLSCAHMCVKVIDPPGVYTSAGRSRRGNMCHSVSVASWPSGHMQRVCPWMTARGELSNDLWQEAGW